MVPRFQSDDRALVQVQPKLFSAVQNFDKARNTKNNIEMISKTHDEFFELIK